MIRCLLVDDEPIALRVLQSHLAHVPDAEVVATATDAIEALNVVRENAIDLIFLDIEMPELSGLGFVESLSAPPPIIFTTAHRHYAVEGFDLEAVDYLVKPVSLPRLFRAFEKYRRLTSEDSNADSGIEPATIQVREDRRTVRVAVRDIVYVESLGDYVTIHTTEARHTTKGTLSDLAKDLAPHGVLRVHRSFLVSLRRVTSFTTTELELSGVRIPVSRSYRQSVLDRLEEVDR